MHVRGFPLMDSFRKAQSCKQGMQSNIPHEENLICTTGSRVCTTLRRSQARPYSRRQQMKIRDLNWHNGIPRYVVFRERCPICRTREFHASMSHPLRSVLQYLAVHPVRCQNCWRRYYWLKPGSIARN